MVAITPPMGNMTFVITANESTVSLVFKSSSEQFFPVGQLLKVKEEKEIKK